MERKILLAITVFGVLGVAAHSPAPINQAKGKRTFHAEQTQAQLAQQQQFNGVVPIVGQVPRVLDEAGREVGTRRTADSGNGGESSLMMGTKNADKVGAITSATKRVVAEQKGGGSPWLWGLLIAVAGFGGWKLVQMKIEKATPVPEFSKRFLKDFENGKI